MSLTVGYTDLQKSVSRYLGYGTVYGVNDGTEQWKDVEDCIKSGLRQFYSPPPLPGQQSAYQWSFLCPVTTISLVDGNDDYILPDNFGGIDGDLTYQPSVSSDTVIVVSESKIRSLRQQKPKDGNPVYAGIRALSTDGASQQKHEIMFWPRPNSNIELEYKYYVLPQALTVDNPYPYGAEAHGETILQSCLAIAEQRLDDKMDIHWQRYMERLAASIQYEQRTNRYQIIGYNGDNSDSLRCNKNRNIEEVTVNGNIIS